MYIAPLPPCPCPSVYVVPLPPYPCPSVYVASYYCISLPTLVPLSLTFLPLSLCVCISLTFLPLSLCVCRLPLARPTCAPLYHILVATHLPTLVPWLPLLAGWFTNGQWFPRLPLGAVRSVKLQELLVHEVGTCNTERTMTTYYTLVEISR